MLWINIMGVMFMILALAAGGVLLRYLGRRMKQVDGVGEIYKAGDKLAGRTICKIRR